MDKNIWRILSIFAGLLFSVCTVLFYAANHYYPKGPSYPTGEYVCQNDDRGPCGEVYKEDTRGLDIPAWVNFFKESDGELLWIGLLFFGVVAYGMSKPDQGAE